MFYNNVHHIYDHTHHRNMQSESAIILEQQNQQRCKAKILRDIQAIDRQIDRMFIHLSIHKHHLSLRHHNKQCTKYILQFLLTLCTKDQCRNQKTHTILVVTTTSPSREIQTKCLTINIWPLYNFKNGYNLSIRKVNRNSCSLQGLKIIASWHTYHICYLTARVCMSFQVTMQLVSISEGLRPRFRVEDLNSRTGSWPCLCRQPTIIVLLNLKWQCCLLATLLILPFMIHSVVCWQSANSPFHDPLSIFRKEEGKRKRRVKRHCYFL